ncbi:Scramblase [Gracilaria domingensis]|nr:Scramblase [Gracilaria domingensis]
MWRRRYSLYVDKTQFARVDSGFLAVDFDMRDEGGAKIASVNKDFTGFARELFTDARQYVLRLDPSYGLQHDGSLVYDAATVSDAAEELGAQKLAERERAVILGAAIAIDFGTFRTLCTSCGVRSPNLCPKLTALFRCVLHSRGPGTAMMMMPPVGAPTPAPPGAGAGAGAGAAVGADVMSDAMGGAPTDGETPYEISDSEVNADGAQASSQPGAWGEDAPPLEQERFGDANQAGDAADESQWATFEEPDHGFDDPYADQDAWSSDSDAWGGGGGGGGVGDEEGGALGGLFEVIKGMIFGDD